MISPPTARIIKMSKDDVHENLISIVESMDRIRQESIASLGSSDDQKMDYLRLTGELASCLDAFIKENNLGSHLDTVKSLIDNNIVLRNYDPLQQGFWDAREPMLKPVLQDASAVLLRDDFISESQSYHVFQGLKYLSINGTGDKDASYESVLPVNGLLHSSSSDVNGHLVKSMANIAGVGVKADLSPEALLKGFSDVGALYVDLPKEFFTQMKKSFPKTVMVDEDGKSMARVIFEPKEFEYGFNAFDALKEYASLDLNEAEDSLVKKTLNLFSFGKKFAEAMKSKMGIDKETVQAPVSAKPGRGSGIESRVYDIDENPELNGEQKTQDNWFSYWAGITDGREMMSSGDFYSATKHLRQAVASGSKDEKAKAERIIKSLRKDFSGLKWVALSTRLQYNINEQAPLEGRIIQHYRSNNLALLKESVLEIPVYRGTDIESVLSQDNGLYYVQTYFDTNDNAEAIIQNIEFISDKKKGNIKVWTADSDSRKSSPDRAAFLGCSSDDFHVDGDGNLDNFGRSRGVRLGPR